VGDTQGVPREAWDIGGDSLTPDDRMYADLVMVMQPKTTVDIYRGHVIVNGVGDDT